ncbi:unnamed protein product [Larinioides sclopetarius]|uniref:Microtubule-associated protein Jupiter n=1 Tax=Larinioides sclopetarius TaxID=280406 RepID=A0AAV1Z1G1_9ARAC
MTSTEFTIGLDGSRNSSKVLKPPGGGSSDIFGTGATQFSSNERQKNKEAASHNTQNRLFGSSDNGASTPSKKHSTSNIFANEPPQPAKSFKKTYGTNEEEKKAEVPSKPITTSIRVRNPPGGKSSGIF